MKTRDLLTEKRLRNLEPMVAEISVDELRSKIQQEETFRLVEVSDLEDFENEHIAGALNIPIHSLEKASQTFRKFQQIVIYCQESTSSLGFAASRQLQKIGFSNVLVLKGGKEAWRNAGLPLEGQKPESPDDQN